MEIITKQQFDNLQVGDTLKNAHYTLLVEAKFANTIIILSNEGISYTYSLNELQNSQYSINQPIQHNCGFPYGDYSDRECLVKVSDISIDDCMVNAMYIRLMNVSNSGFKDYYNVRTWKFAVLITNNVDLVK